MSVQDIQFWQIRKRANRRKPWEVRWRVGPSAFSRSFLTKALGETYRAKLFGAAKAGETFSPVTGEPVNWELSAETLYAHVRAYVALRWNDGSSPNARKGTVENLIPTLVAFVDPKKHKTAPEETVLRKALREWGLRPPTWGEALPSDAAAALAWLSGASRPVADLAESAAVRELLGALRLGMWGQPLANGTAKARRSALYGCLDYAVERKLLGSNPVQGIKVRRARTSDQVSPRRVPSFAQAHALLDAIRADSEEGKHLYGFFACMYFAGMRPSEVRDLKRVDCHLPSQGWGRLTLAGSAPEISAAWTDDGERFGARELKHRATGDVRVVPIPPDLVTILRDHLDAYGAASDGRLFWDSRHDGFPHIAGDHYRRVWHRVRNSALTPAEKAVHLAQRPYDLRHGNASFLLGIGIAPTEVARRLGHSVAMLYTTYAHWLTGQEEQANKIIDAAYAQHKALTSETDSHGPTAGQEDQTGTSQ